MEVGIFILMQQRGYHQTSAEVLRGAVEQTVAADQAGFDTAWYAEHQSLDEVAALVEWTDCIGCAGRRGSAGQAHGNRLQPASQLAHPRRGGSMTHTQTPPAQGREHRNGTHHDPRLVHWPDSIFANDQNSRDPARSTLPRAGLKTSDY